MDNGYGHTYRYTIRESGVNGYFSQLNGNNLINTLIPTVTINRRTPDGGIEIFDYGTPLSGQMPELQDKTEEDLEELLDLFGYGTPLFGELLKTGDEVPVYPFVFGGIGLVAVVLLLVLGRKRKKPAAKR